MSDRLELAVLSETAGEVEYQPLPLDRPGSHCTVRLRCLVGASGAHLMLREGGRTRFRGELAAESGEEVSVHLERCAEGEVRAWSVGRRLVTLPLEGQYQPLPPILLRPPRAGLDLALVIDGTVRTISEAPNSDGVDSVQPLLADADAWAPHVEALTRAIARLAKGYGDLRLSLIAFGDHAPPGAGALDLVPTYHLWPPDESERVLRPIDRETLGRCLLEIPPSSGGDFVDALADALEACTALAWRQEARKLVIVDGDSPGFSLLHPAPSGTDVGLRRKDVDTQAAVLHERGVEIVTLFHDRLRTSGAYGQSFQRELLDHSEGQYAGLASRPETAFRLSTLDWKAFTDRIEDPVPALGRGASWAKLVAVETPGEESPKAEKVRSSKGAAGKSRKTERRQRAGRAQRRSKNPVTRSHS